MLTYSVHAYQGDESMSYEDCAAFAGVFVSDTERPGYAVNLANVANLEGEDVRPSLHVFAGESC